MHEKIKQRIWRNEHESDVTIKALKATSTTCVNSRMFLVTQQRIFMEEKICINRKHVILFAPQCSKSQLRVIGRVTLHHQGLLDFQNEKKA